MLGGSSLRREARPWPTDWRPATSTAAGTRLPNLCGRDPSTLDAPDLARATVESVAENTADAVVGPLVWGAVAGLPGLMGGTAR